MAHGTGDWHSELDGSTNTLHLEGRKSALPKANSDSGRQLATNSLLPARHEEHEGDADSGLKWAERERKRKVGVTQGGNTQCRA